MNTSTATTPSESASSRLINSALADRVRDAMDLSKKCGWIYVQKGFKRQKCYSDGQEDAFQAVLNWMEESKSDEVSSVKQNPKS